jgi:FkbM family methyltransferase
MLKYLKIIFLFFTKRFGYNIRKQEIIDKSNDPIWVVSKILDLEKVNLVVDAGASIGDITIKFTEDFPNSEVHALEPFPKFFEILNEKSKIYNRIIPYACALSNTNGKALLNINKSEGTNSLLNTEFHKSNPHSSLLETKGTIEVETKTLDKIFPKETIDLLKLDLQGGEYNALKGAENLLKHGRIKCIICEVMFQKSYKNQSNGSELILYLEEQGFKIFNFYQNHYHHGELLQSDIIFYHKSISNDVDRLKKENFLPFSNYLATK